MILLGNGKGFFIGLFSQRYPLLAFLFSSSLELEEDPEQLF